MKAVTFERLPQMVAELSREVRELKTVLERKSEPSTIDNPNDLLTPKEASDLLRCSITTLWRYEKSGKVKSEAIGGKRLYRREDLMKALKK